MMRFLLPIDRTRAVDDQGRKLDCGARNHFSFRPGGGVAVTPTEVKAGALAFHIAVEVDDDPDSPFTGTLPRFVPVCKACAENFLRGEMA